MKWGSSFLSGKKKNLEVGGNIQVNNAEFCVSETLLAFPHGPKVAVIAPNIMCVFKGKKVEREASITSASLASFLNQKQLKLTRILS